jgi:hypothetical protein
MIQKSNELAIPKGYGIPSTTYLKTIGATTYLKTIGDAIKLYIMDPTLYPGYVTLLHVGKLVINIETDCYEFRSNFAEFREMYDVEMLARSK